MGVRILHDPSEGKAALYDSVSGHAFGPVIGDLELFASAQDAALAFLDHLNVDARTLAPSILEVRLEAFRQALEKATE
jgi:hypothetical protein